MIHDVYTRVIINISLYYVFYYVFYNKKRV